jgi:hypothetical protein
MKVRILSVKQPYAWLLVNGLKTIENRSFPTNYRGPLLINASLKEEQYLDPKDDLHGIRVPLNRRRRSSHRLCRGIPEQVILWTARLDRQRIADASVHTDEGKLRTLPPHARRYEEACIKSPLVRSYRSARSLGS